MTLLASDAARSRAAALVVALFAVTATWNVSLNTVLARSGVAEAVRVTYDLTLPLSMTEAGAVLAVSTVAVVVVLAALARTFAPEVDALGGSETPAETAAAFARAVVVAVGGLLAAAIGLAVFVVPGLVVLVHLPLVFVAVAADGESIGRAVDRTWTRARGSRARVAAVGLAVVAVPLATAVVATLTALLLPVVELALGTAVTTVAAAAGVAAFTAIADSINGTGTDRSRTDRVAPTTSRQL
ncbi:hypothetical protein [Haloplanus aerogenes]|uniref:Glycerophosphoryl diester phosphodiesterase membrane domain-containing protein n=1 Tax=Haloplanus aerogenes TaxID=660522 RepID=A0A3M0DQ28_9EURY|nr:hypothetical protein [Haloplanus aerogenes]AZH24464.1 hypothetical protein DU502_03300 [Haloplanus aerogenes]RMB23888.1 hypothetical protein ATH50_1118 [Haloplanus aerogenes]